MTDTHDTAEATNNDSNDNATVKGFDTQTRANVRSIVACLCAHAIHSASVSYSGGGDSGQTDEVTAVNANNENMAIPDTARVACHVEYQDDPQDQSLVDALDVLLDDVLEWAGHGSYGNDEGGRGDMTIYNDGRVQLSHTDYYVESDYSEHQQQVSLEPEAEPEAAAA